MPDTLGSHHQVGTPQSRRNSRTVKDEELEELFGKLDNVRDDVIYKYLQTRYVKCRFVDWGDDCRRSDLMILSSQIRLLAGHLQDNPADVQNPSDHLIPQLDQTCHDMPLKKDENDVLDHTLARRLINLSSQLRQLSDEALASRQKWSLDSLSGKSESIEGTSSYCTSDESVFLSDADSIISTVEESHRDALLETKRLASSPREHTCQVNSDAPEVHASPAPPITADHSRREPETKANESCGFDDNKGSLSDEKIAETHADEVYEYSKNEGTSSKYEKSAITNHCELGPKATLSTPPLITRKSRALAEPTGHELPRTLGGLEMNESQVREQAESFLETPTNLSEGDSRGELATNSTTRHSRSTQTKIRSKTSGQPSMATPDGSNELSSEERRKLREEKRKRRLVHKKNREDVPKRQSKALVSNSERQELRQCRQKTYTTEEIRNYVETDNHVRPVRKNQQPRTAKDPSSDSPTTEDKQKYKETDKHVRPARKTEQERNVGDRASEGSCATNDMQMSTTTDSHIRRRKEKKEPNTSSSVPSKESSLSSDIRKKQIDRMLAERAGLKIGAGCTGTHAERSNEAAAWKRRRDQKLGDDCEMQDPDRSSLSEASKCRSKTLERMRRERGKGTKQQKESVSSDKDREAKDIYGTRSRVVERAR